MYHIFQSLAITGEEYCAGPRTITNTDDVALYKWGTVRRRIEGLVVPPMARGRVGDGILVET